MARNAVQSHLQTDAHTRDLGSLEDQPATSLLNSFHFKSWCFCSSAIEKIHTMLTTTRIHRNRPSISQESLVDTPAGPRTSHARPTRSLLWRC